MNFILTLCLVPLTRPRRVPSRSTRGFRPGLGLSPVSFLEVLEGRVVLSTAKVASFAVIIPTMVIAGNPTTATVIALDANHDQISGFAGNATPSSSDPAAVLSGLPYVAYQPSENGSHQFTATFNTPGVQTLTYRAGNGSTGTATVTVVPRVASFLVTSPSYAIVGNQTTVTVIPLDSNGRTIPDYFGTIHFTSSDPGATLPNEYTFTQADAGAHVFPITFANSGKVRVSATAVNGATGSATDQVNQKVSRFGVTTGAASFPGIATTVTLVAYDANGRTIPYYTGQVSFASSDPRAILPATYTFNPAVDNGAKTLAVTFLTPGSQVITTRAVNGSTGSAGTQVVAINDGSFSDPKLAAGTSKYAPGATSWTFNAAAGVTTNASAFTAGNPNAPTNQVGFVQGNGIISQTIVMPAGTYSVGFLAAQRVNVQAAYQSIGVYLDGTQLLRVTPATGQYATYATNFTINKSGSHTIALIGLNPLGGDNTAFVTQIQVNRSLASASPAQNPFLITADGRLYNTNTNKFVAKNVQSVSQAADGTVFFLSNSTLFRVATGAQAAPQQVATNVQTFALAGAVYYVVNKDGTFTQQSIAAAATAKPTPMGKVGNVEVKNVKISNGQWSATVQFDLPGNNSLSVDMNSKGVTGGSGKVTIGNTTTTIAYMGSTGLTGSISTGSGSSKLNISYNGASISGNVSFTDGTNTLHAGYDPQKGASATYSYTDESGTFSGTISSKNGNTSGTLSYSDPDSGLSVSGVISQGLTLLSLSIPC